MKPITISDVGEKRLIAEFIKPFFNSSDDVAGVGDDCAMLDANGEEIWLFSTDRVPADLIAFRLGILDYWGLGKYLARLNISDIAACGGQPIALLLNLGLPDDLRYEDFRSLCRGFGEVVANYGCKVLGGDTTHSREISISATSIGKVAKGAILTRRGAKPGDTIFGSRPIGLTPAAFAYYLKCRNSLMLTEEEILILNQQFTSMEPLVSLGQLLSTSGKCSSCMDNTDGLGQSLLELSIASKAAFIVKEDQINLPPLVNKTASHLVENPISLAFSAGADFSLVGTLNETWSQDQITSQFGMGIIAIGYVEEGRGVYLETTKERRSLEFTGWNYFSAQTNKV